MAVIYMTRWYIYVGLSENVGCIPNEIAIFHRDNDQQNHWLQWGTQHFQTHPFGSLRCLKFEPVSSGLRPIRQGLVSVLKSFVFLLEEPEQLLTRETFNLSDFKNMWKVIELVNPLKMSVLADCHPSLQGKQRILKKLTKFISNLFYLLLSLLVVCTIFDDIDIWYVAVPAKIWKHQPVLSPLFSLLYPQISPIGLVSPSGFLWNIPKNHQKSTAWENHVPTI